MDRGRAGAQAPGADLPEALAPGRGPTAPWCTILSLNCPCRRTEPNLLIFCPGLTNEADMSEILRRLAVVLESRKGADPATSYVAGLYDRGLDAILKKLGEEATETVIAAKGGNRKELIHEVADLWFHSLVLLAQQGSNPDDVLAELERRFGESGHDEKAKRGK